MENLLRLFEKKKINMKRLTQFKIEFLRPFTGCRKVLGKIPVEKYFFFKKHA